ncbi:hypothetical protein ILT06_30370 [Bacillus sp. 17RED48]|nr:hypothetical protein [Bacillus sp. 17RED48]
MDTTWRNIFVKRGVIK